MSLTQLNLNQELAEKVFCSIQIVVTKVVSERTNDKLL